MQHAPPRRRVQVLFPSDLYDRLVKTCAASRETLTSYIARAVEEQLEGTSDRQLLFRRLDRHTDAQHRMQNDLELLQEALGVFVQIWFAHNPPVPNEQKAKARKEAEQRYQQFATFLAQRFNAGHRFAHDLPLEDDDGELVPNRAAGASSTPPVTTEPTSTKLGRT